MAWRFAAKTLAQHDPNIKSHVLAVSSHFSTHIEDTFSKDLNILNVKVI